ncbi:CDGSH iron-sulfur domain-containing protein 1 [Fukomys damarensis]|uniref:CDGSH iron-sulfur domain-containing protein 2 n=1 Tax=Fukomys damarensis TaxID=885580 RepID=A0A091DFA7_FUKDA|nr:CDGSH iron-sulfur domain-containing protein 1 [Fukomys damarensis]
MPIPLVGTGTLRAREGTKECQPTSASARQTWAPPGPPAAAGGRERGEGWQSPSAASHPVRREEGGPQRGGLGHSREDPRGPPTRPRAPLLPRAEGSGGDRESSPGQTRGCSNVRGEWIAAVTIVAGTAATGYLAYKRFCVKDHRSKSMVKLHIQKDNPKAVHAFDMEEIKAVYCRSWRSQKFPLCDGSHTKHDEETGDNVGPLSIRKGET